MKVTRGVRAVEADGQKVIARAIEAGPPRDEYGELATALRSGRELAKEYGHRLSKWKRRRYAPNTTADARCLDCGAQALVNLEVSSRAEGPATHTRCLRRGTS